MNGYLGEKTIKQKDSPFKSYKRKDWVKLWINNYAYIDGEEHKQWLIDQITQICYDAKIIIKEASWDNGEKEYRFSLGKTNKAYKDWLRNDDDWFHGVAP